MNRKLMLLALAAISAAIFALPATATAEVAHVSSVGKFTVASESAQVSTEHNSAVRWGCASVTGSGEFTTTKTGKLTLSFHGCVENFFGTTCTGEAPGDQSLGTITTTQLDFHLIEIGYNTPGILITPNAGHFVTYSCNILGTKTLGGNGLIGHIATPCDGTKSTTHTISFASVANGTQKMSQATTTGTKYDLTLNGTTAALDLSMLIHFIDGVARNIICT